MKKMTSGRKWNRRKNFTRSLQRQGRVVLLPASELPQMPAWHRRAKALRQAELVIVPANNPQLERAAQRIKVTMSKYGRPVIVTKVH